MRDGIRECFLLTPRKHDLPVTLYLCLHEHLGDLGFIEGSRTCDSTHRHQLVLWLSRGLELHHFQFGLDPALSPVQEGGRPCLSRSCLFDHH